jgi:hypothetical protein
MFLVHSDPGFFWSIRSTSAQIDELIVEIAYTTLCVMYVGERGGWTETISLD